MFKNQPYNSSDGDSGKENKAGKANKEKGAEGEEEEKAKKAREEEEERRRREEEQRKAKELEVKHITLQSHDPSLKQRQVRKERVQGGPSAWIVGLG